jgi:thioredoxin-related protein
MPDITYTRRALLAAAAAAAFCIFRPAAATAAQEPSADFHSEPWLLRSFLDLREDFGNAAKAGKNFAILWEMQGCPYCKLLHTVNFKDARISSYIQDNFDVLQLDLLGAREVTDFDGEKLPEKLLAAKYNVKSTPVVQFFPASAARRAQELGRVGYIKPDEFFLMLRFVREKGYEKGPFDEWMKTAR